MKSPNVCFCAMLVIGSGMGELHPDEVEVENLEERMDEQ